jgi:putative hemolysin
MGKATGNRAAASASARGSASGSASGSDISVAAIRRKGAAGKLLALLSPILDRALGIRAFREMFEKDALQGLERYEFIERFIEKEGIDFGHDEAEFAAIPATGPVVVVANHPLGGLEGILLTWLLRIARSDYKVFVNIMDSFLVELKDFFIFTNPMARGSAYNYESLRISREWLAAGHCFLIFPAGRVGLYRPAKGYVTDEAWDGTAVRLGLMTQAAFVPVFIEGESSALFSLLSEYVYPMKLLFLIWEFLRSLGKRVVFHVGSPIPYSRLASMGRRRAVAWLRMRTFLLCPSGKGPLRRRSRASRRGSGSGGPDLGRGILHPEVEDYILRYGLDEAERAELAEAVKGDAAAVAEIKRLST